MPVCTYDNPDTMSRECWSDGKLLCAYSAELFFLKEWPLLPSEFFFGANIGDWKTGQLIGDDAALPDEYRLNRSA